MRRIGLLAIVLIAAGAVPLQVHADAGLSAGGSLAGPGTPPSPPPDAPPGWRVPEPPPPPPLVQVTVQPGDTLFALADAWGVDRQAALDANPQLADPNLIHPGDILNMPGGTAPATPPALISTPSLSAAGSASTPAGPVAFPWGYCTWYVATRRLVTWRGDAWQWWWNARAAGRPEGQTPQPGAIMVTWESSIGHVAYVESVNGASWTVREANYVGFGIISSRTLVPGATSVVGFIY